MIRNVFEVKQIVFENSYNTIVLRCPPETAPRPQPYPCRYARRRQRGHVRPQALQHRSRAHHQHWRDCPHAGWRVQTPPLRRASSSRQTRASSIRPSPRASSPAGPATSRSPLCSFSTASPPARFSPTRLPHRRRHHHHRSLLERYTHPQPRPECQRYPRPRRDPAARRRPPKRHLPGRVEVSHHAIDLLHHRRVQLCARGSHHQWRQCCQSPHFGDHIDHSQVQYEDLGVTLKATPTVQKSGLISLHLDLKIESLAGGSIDNIPVLNNNSFTSDITVPDGGTAFLVSNLTRNQSSAVTGIPGLSELPVFRARRNSRAPPMSPSS